MVADRAARRQNGRKQGRNHQMTSDDRLAQLERKIQHLTDRQEILDCIVRNSRGNDRFDAELVTSSYHPDGVHELGSEVIPGLKYGEHANQAHGAMCEQNLHHVTMHSCEIDGDVAHAESYVIGIFLDKGSETSRILSGRYIDRLEKRDGAWRIMVRRATVEVVLEGAASVLNTPAFRSRGYLKGARDKGDLSYARPLTAEGGERW
jgi:hypothetical protein